MFKLTMTISDLNEQVGSHHNELEKIRGEKGQSDLQITQLRQQIAQLLSGSKMQGKNARWKVLN